MRPIVRAIPTRIGTSRTIVVDPTEHPRVGSFQYPETLPLADKEVVLTLDDSPRPIYTEKVLDILAAHCVKATYFLIGNHAKEFPKVVQRIAAEGHTIGTHSMKHPLTFNRMGADRLRKEVEDGIAAVQTRARRRQADRAVLPHPGPSALRRRRQLHQCRRA